MTLSDYISGKQRVLQKCFDALEPKPMTFEEFAIAVKVEGVRVRILPDGGYLTANEMGFGWHITRSRKGDYSGWREQWMFDDPVLTVLNFQAYPQRTMTGWLRRRFVDGNGHSLIERPDGRIEGS